MFQFLLLTCFSRACFSLCILQGRELCTGAERGWKTVFPFWAIPIDNSRANSWVGVHWGRKGKVEKVQSPRGGLSLCCTSMYLLLFVALLSINCKGRLSISGKRMKLLGLERKSQRVLRCRQNASPLFSTHVPMSGYYAIGMLKWSLCWDDVARDPICFRSVQKMQIIMA